MIVRLVKQVSARLRCHLHVLVNLPATLSGDFKHRMVRGYGPGSLAADRVECACGRTFYDNGRCWL